MRVRGRASWSMRIDRWNYVADQALWVRAVERIEVPAGGLVPGPLDEDDLPAPSPGAQDPGLAAAWKRWWTAIAAGITADARPDLDVLADEAELNHLVDGRFEEFHWWQAARKDRGVGDWLQMVKEAGAHRWRPRRRDPDAFDPLRETHLVADLERRLGRTAPAFVLDLLLLPVPDDVVREAGPNRYLVPERVYDGPDWRDILEPLVLRQFG